MARRERLSESRAFWLVLALAPPLGAALGVLSLGEHITSLTYAIVAAWVGGFVGLLTAPFPVLALSRKRLLVALPTVYGVSGLAAVICGLAAPLNTPIVTIVVFLNACIVGGLCFRNVRGHRAARCPYCDYRVKGLTSPLCPECGKDWATPLVRSRALQRSRRGR